MDINRCIEIFDENRHDIKFIAFKNAFEKATNSKYFDEMSDLVDKMQKLTDAGKANSDPEFVAVKAKLDEANDKFDKLFGSVIVSTKSANDVPECVDQFNEWLSAYIHAETSKKIASAPIPLLATSQTTPITGEPYGLSDGYIVKFDRTNNTWVPCGTGTSCGKTQFIKHCDKIGLDKNNVYACKTVYDCLLSGDLTKLEECVKTLNQTGEGNNFFDKAKNEIETLNPELVLELVKKFNIPSIDNDTAIQSFDDWVKTAPDQMQTILRGNQPMTQYVRALIDQANRLLKIDTSAYRMAQLCCVLPSYDKRGQLVGTSGHSLPDYKDAQQNKNIGSILGNYATRKNCDPCAIGQYARNMRGGAKSMNPSDMYNHMLQIGGADTWDALLNETLAKLKANGMVLNKRTEAQIKDVLETYNKTINAQEVTVDQINRFQKVLDTFGHILDAQSQSINVEVLKRYELDQNSFDGMVSALEKHARNAFSLRVWLTKTMAQLNA